MLTCYGILLALGDPLQTNDRIGRLRWRGSANDADFIGAEITTEVTNGNSNRSNTTCDMIFGTMGSTETGALEKMRLTGAGNVTVTGDVISGPLNTGSNTGKGVGIYGANGAVCWNQYKWSVHFGTKDWRIEVGRTSSTIKANGFASSKKVTLFGGPSVIRRFDLQYSEKVRGLGVADTGSGESATNTSSILANGSASFAGADVDVSSKGLSDPGVHKQS